MNALVAVPAILTLLAFTVCPLVMLDGSRAYVSLVRAHPAFAGTIAATWFALAHWLTRRAAETLLLRRSGAKLRLRA